MGTQQILMIILSVIVVGAAIAVGIQMFDTQSDNQTRNMLVAEAMQQGVMAQAWYRTPTMMGGGGNKIEAELPDDYLLRIAKYIQRGVQTPVIRNEIGTFTISADNEFTGSTFPTDPGIWILISGVANAKPTIVVEFAVNITGDRGPNGDIESIVPNTEIM
jgi:hypothetical protein